MSNLNKDDRIAVLQLEAADMMYLQKALLCSNYMIRAHLSLIEAGKADVKNLSIDLCQTVQNMEQADRHIAKNISKIKKTINQILQEAP